MHEGPHFGVRTSGSGGSKVTIAQVDPGSIIKSVCKTSMLAFWSVKVEGVLMNLHRTLYVQVVPSNGLLVATVSNTKPFLVQQWIGVNT